MSRYKNELAKLESRTPLFYYPFHIELKSDLAKEMVARHFFSHSTSYVLSMEKKDVEKMLTEENMKVLSGKYTFHYDDPKETEGQRISMVKHFAPRNLAQKGIAGFLHFIPGADGYGIHLKEGEDFEVIIGERVEIEQPEKITFDDIPDLMGVEGN